MSQTYPLYTLQTTFLPAGGDEDFVYFSAYFSPRIYTDGANDPVDYSPHMFHNWTSATADVPLLLTAYSENDSPVKLGSIHLDTTYERDPHFRHDRRYSDLWAKIFSSQIKYAPYQIAHQPELTPEVYNQREEMAAVLQKNSVAVYPSAAGMLSQEIISYFTNTALGHGGIRIRDKKAIFTQAGEPTGNTSAPLDVSQIPPQKGFQNPPTPSLDSSVNDEVDSASGSGVPKNYNANSDSSQQKPEFHALLSHIMETPVLAQRLGLLRHFRIPWRIFEEKLGTQRGLEPQMLICLTLASPEFPLVQPIVLTKCTHNPGASYLWDRFCARPAEQAHVGGCLMLSGYALSPIDPNTSAASLVAATSGTGDLAPPVFRTTGLHLVRKPVPNTNESEADLLKRKSKEKLKLGVSVDGLTKSNNSLALVALNIGNQNTAALARSDGLPPAPIDLQNVPQVEQDDLIRGYTVDIAFDQPHSFEEVSESAPYGHNPPQDTTQKFPPDPFSSAPEWVSLCSRNVTVSDPDANFRENFADEGQISLHAQIAPAPMYGWLTPYLSPLKQEPEKVSPMRNWYLLWTASASYLLYEKYPDLDAQGLRKHSQPENTYHVPEKLRDGSYVCVNVRLPEEWVEKENLTDKDDYLRAYEIVSVRPLSQASLFGSIVSIEQNAGLSDDSHRLVSVRTSLETFGPNLVSASLVLPRPASGDFDEYLKKQTWIMASGDLGLSADSHQVSPVNEMEATFQEMHDDRPGVFSVNVPFLKNPILVQASGGEGLNKNDHVWLVLKDLPPEGSEIYPNATLGLIQTQSGQLPSTNPGTPDPIDFYGRKITVLINNIPTTFPFSENCIFEDELAQPAGITDPAEADIQDATLSSTWRPQPGDSIIFQSHRNPSGQPVVHRMVHDPACVIGIIDRVPESEDFFDLRLCVLGAKAMVPTQKKVRITLSPDTQLQGRLSGHRMPPINVLLAVFCKSRPDDAVIPIKATASRIEVFSQPEEESSGPVLRDETDSGFIYRWVNGSTPVKTEVPVENATPPGTRTDLRLYLDLGFQPPVHGAPSPLNSPENIEEQLLLGSRPNLLPEGLLLNGKRIAFCANSEASPAINILDSSLYSPPSIYALKVSLVGVLQQADPPTPQHYIFTLKEDQEDDRWRPAGTQVSTDNPPLIIRDLIFADNSANAAQNEAKVKTLLGHVVSIEILFDANGKSFLSADANKRTIRGRVKTVETSADETSIVMETLGDPITITDLDPKTTISPRQLIEVSGQVLLVQDEPSLVVFAPTQSLKRIDAVALPPALASLPNSSFSYTPTAYQGYALNQGKDKDTVPYIQYIFTGSPNVNPDTNSPLIWGDPTNPLDPAQPLCTLAADADPKTIVAKARYPIFSPFSGPNPETIPFPKAQFLYVDTTVFKFLNNNLIVSSNSNDTEPTNPWDDKPSSTPSYFGNLRIEFELPGDSVLPLRFGRRYKARMRMVDLAGNRPSAPDKMHNGLEPCVVRTCQPFMRFDPVLPPVLTDVHTAAPLPEPQEPKAAPPKKPGEKVRPPPSLTPSVNTQLYNGENEPPRYVPDDLVAIIQPIKKENRPVATPTTEYEGPPNNSRGFGSKSDRFVALPVNYEQPVAAADVRYPVNPADVITEAEWKLEPPQMDLRLAEMTGEIDRLVANVGNPCPTLEAHTLVKLPDPKRNPRFSKLWKVSGQPCLPDTYSSGVTIRAIRGPLPTGPQLFSPRRLPPDVRGKLRELHDEFAVFDYAGNWPKIPHVPCVLQPGASDAFKVWLEPNGGNRLVFSLPPGEVADVEVSSFLVERNLARMAAYLLLRDTDASWMTSLPRRVGDAFLFLKAYCLLGLHRSLTPSRLLRLIHAVHTPNRDPESKSIELLGGGRPAGEVKQTFRMVVGVHRNSTGTLRLHSTYQRYEDSLDADLPNIPAHEQKEIFWQDDRLYQINHDEWKAQSFDMWHVIPAPIQPLKSLPSDLAHGVQDTVLEQPLPLWQGEQQTLTATQVFPDTRHYRIYVQPEGRTRFTEYFPTGQCVSRYSTDSGVVDVPASVPPDPPVFAYAHPLFSWSQVTEQNAITRTRTGNALRIFLRRPWFSSGRDEMLAITFDDSFDDERPASRIGCDPIWSPLRPASRPGMKFTQAFYNQLQKEGAWLFTPKFCIDRKLWFVDFILEEDTDLTIYGRTPFIQLGLSRYQPHAISNCNFSKGIRTDFISLLPRRELTLTRVKNGGADTIIPKWKVDPSRANVEITYMLEKRLHGLSSDLSWAFAQPLPLGPSASGNDLLLPTLDPAYEYRVVVRETENLRSFSADSALPNAQDVSGNNNDLLHRLTYLDIFTLPGAS